MRVLHCEWTVTIAIYSEYIGAEMRLHTWEACPHRISCAQHYMLYYNVYLYVCMFDYIRIERIRTTHPELKAFSFWRTILRSCSAHNKNPIRCTYITIRMDRICPASHFNVIVVVIAPVRINTHASVRDINTNRCLVMRQWCDVALPLLLAKRWMD